MSDNSRLQPLRRVSNGQIYHVAARFHPGARVYVILWDEILQAFPGAITVLNGTIVVPWVRDAAFRLIEPKCISYLPGKVLGVMKDGDASRPLSQHFPVMENMEIAPHISNDRQWTMPSVENIPHPPVHQPPPGDKWHFTIPASQPGTYMSSMSAREAPRAHFRPLVVPTETDAIDISDSGSHSLRKQLSAPQDTLLPELLEIAVRDKVLIMPGTTEPSHGDLSADQIDTIVEAFLSTDASLDTSNDNKGDSDTSNSNGPNLPMHHDTFYASVPSAKPKMPMELGPSEEQEHLDLTLLEESDDSGSEEDETLWSDEEMWLSDEDRWVSMEEMRLSKRDKEVRRLERRHLKKQPPGQEATTQPSPLSLRGPQALLINSAVDLS